MKKGAFWWKPDRRILIMRIKEIKSLLRQNVSFYALGLIAVYCMKLLYSRASSDDLIWILGPTAEVVELLSNISFEKEAQAGYISRSTGILIAPACAGINFLIMAFCTAFFSCVHRLRTYPEKLMWTGLACLGSYFLTIVVKAMRIIISMDSLNTSTS